MEQRSEVVIVMVRCARNSEPYGVRFEQTGQRRWNATWAFAVGEQSASREGYDRGEIAGQFGFGPEYPGCPHCGNSGVMKCHCGNVSCYDGGNTAKCGWCKKSARISGIIDSLGAGSDR
jgi:hypothetical protein